MQLYTAIQSQLHARIYNISTKILFSIDFPSNVLRTVTELLMENSSTLYTACVLQKRVDQG